MSMKNIKRKLSEQKTDACIRAQHMYNIIGAINTPHALDVENRECVQRAVFATFTQSIDVREQIRSVLGVLSYQDMQPIVYPNDSQIRARDSVQLCSREPAPSRLATPQSVPLQNECHTQGITIQLQ